MSTTITTNLGTTMTLRHPNLDILLSKHIVLEDKEKARLISELSLDDKRYLGNYLLDEELFLLILFSVSHDYPLLVTKTSTPSS